MGFYVRNLNEAIKNGRIDTFIPEINAFKSKNNPDVENFLKKNAIQFCKLKQSITYLVFGEETGDLLAYFTLAFKIMEFPLETLSKSMIKILERNGNRTENTIQVPGMLLAQWSKNFAFKNNVSGKLIMELIEREFLYVQNKIGGSFTFLECEADKTRLLERYAELGYTPVSERMSQVNKPLIQLIKKL